MWPGHANLASITSAAEAAFVWGSSCGGSHLPHPRDGGYLALGGYKVEVNATRTAGWAWADGSPTDYLFSDSGLALGLWHLAIPLTPYYSCLVLAYDGSGLLDNGDTQPPTNANYFLGPCCSAPRPSPAATGTPAISPSITSTPASGNAVACELGHAGWKPHHLLHACGQPCADCDSDVPVVPHCINQVCSVFSIIRCHWLGFPRSAVDFH